MEVKTIQYKRVKNLGNFESEAVVAQAEIDEIEDPLEAIADLRFMVLKSLGIEGRSNATNEHKSDDLSKNKSSEKPSELPFP